MNTTEKVLVAYAAAFAVVLGLSMACGPAAKASTAARGLLFEERQWVVECAMHPGDRQHEREAGLSPASQMAFSLRLLTGASSEDESALTAGLYARMATHGKNHSTSA